MEIHRRDLKIVNFRLWEIRDAFNEFPDFFVQAFKIVIDS